MEFIYVDWFIEVCLFHQLVTSFTSPVPLPFSPLSLVSVVSWVGRCWRKINDNPKSPEKA